MSGLYHTLEWIRIAADLTFLLVGAVPLTWAVLLLVFGERTLREDGVEIRA
jgi:hypothetical protein